MSYASFNALPGDALVLSADIVCVVLDSTNPLGYSVVTLPKGSAFTWKANAHTPVFANPNQKLFFGYIVILGDFVVLDPYRRAGLDVMNFTDVNTILDASFVAPRNAKGDVIYRSKVKHPKGKWGRAAPGATTTCYVYADTEGNRYEYLPTDAYYPDEFRIKLFRYSEADLVRLKAEQRATMATPVKEHKKFPDLGRAKQRTLYVVGYYNQFGDVGMLENAYPAPAWDAKWWIWSADRDGALIQPVLNCAEYVVATQKYANLSKQFGTEAKEVFKKIEKSSETYYGVVVIGNLSGGDVYDDDRYEQDPKHSGTHDGTFIGRDAGYRMKPDRLAAIKQIIPDGAPKKLGKTVAAIALPTVAEAVLLRMSYEGDLDFKIIDLQTLEEHVI